MAAPTPTARITRAATTRATPTAAAPRSLAIRTSRVEATVRGTPRTRVAGAASRIWSRRAARGCSIASPCNNCLSSCMALDSSSPLEASIELLRRAQEGDSDALDALLTRYRPRLKRWAHRRLPPWARGLSDTDDLVQDTLVKAIRNLRDFVSIGVSGFQNYLRSAVGNAIRDEIRKARNRPALDGPDS